jgi:hypothetical protein
VRCVTNTRLGYYSHMHIIRWRLNRALHNDVARAFASVLLYWCPNKHTLGVTLLCIHGARATCE